jgi:hypothetical protein
LAIAGANLDVTANNSAAVNLYASQAIRNLRLNDSAAVNFGTGGKTLQTSSVIASAASKIDVADGTLRVSDTSSFNTIRSYIRSARNTGLSGLWSGNGITSSVAADSSRLAVASVITGGNIIVRPAVIGDLNLDNTVSISDFIDLSANFNGSSTTWATGDLNYDDLTTIADFIDLSANFNTIYSGSSTPAPAFAPSPASIAADAPAEEEILGTTVEAATTCSKNAAAPAKSAKAKKTHSRASRHHRPKARIGLSRRP